MPLPQALAARLAKRGIIKLSPQQKEPEQEVVAPVHEEIIAEDYDETPQTETKENSSDTSFEKYQGWFACPNKWNVYHECTPTCKELWKDVKEIDKEYNRKRLRMLQKYPLAEHWREILDIGIGRYYYWNTETNLVSWLPPGHAKCQVSLSAAELRKKMIQEREERLKEEKQEDAKSDDEKVSDDEATTVEIKKRPRDDDAGYESTEDSSEETERKKERKEKGSREKKVKEKESTRKKKKENESLDPMDPAAYSDCPRGTWSSGLHERNEARTGVDTTASGPLFQMRPYPNPGAVLRANAAATGGNQVGPTKPS